MEFGGPRYKNFGNDMCLLLGSLLSRSVPLLLGINVQFQVQFQDGVLEGFKPPFLRKIKQPCISLCLFSSCHLEINCRVVIHAAGHEMFRSSGFNCY